MGDITFFAETNFRNEKKRFGIKVNDRRKHVYIVGKTGMGKTTLLENMAIQDIQAGRGIGIVDPHGEFAEKMLDFIPPERLDDVVYINPADLDWPVAFNVMEKIGSEQRHLIASGLMSVFKKIWIDLWSARMEYILNNTILALLEYPDSTLLGINRMLADKDFRKEVISHVTDPVVQSFWTMEFARYHDKFQSEAIAPIQNKAGQFTANPVIRNIIGQPKSTIDIRKIMDEGKILILNLSKGKIGEDNSRLLGALMITRLQLAAMSRVDIPEEERRDFFLYVDEFQNFATDSFKYILSEARKYHLSLTLAHQYITQMEETVRDAIFGNVGTLILFRVGAADAEFLEKEFAPEFTADDLVNLGLGDIYLKLMINGVASHPFSAHGLGPVQLPEKSSKEEIIEKSRQKYALPRLQVEETIKKWAEPIIPTAAAATSGVDLAADTGTPAFPKKPAFESECWECGKKTSTPFQPDGKRPVYCPICLEKFRKGELLPHTPKERKISPPYADSFRAAERPQSFNQENLSPRRVEAPPRERFRRPPARTMSSEPVRREIPKPISLSEALESKKGKKTETETWPENKKRKEIDLGDLRKALEESLYGVKPDDKEIETGKNVPENAPGRKTVKPGEKIKF
jgi:CxxC-x17-CxxC domain-containing protein